MIMKISTTGKSGHVIVWPPSAPFHRTWVATTWFLGSPRGHIPTNRQTDRSCTMVTITAYAMQSQWLLYRPNRNSNSPNFQVGLANHSSVQQLAVTSTSIIVKDINSFKYLIRTTSSSVGKVFGHQWLSRWLKFRRSRFKSKWKREFLKNSENYLRCDNSSIKGTLCSAKPGCRIAQLVKCLVTSGYQDGSSGKWNDSHPAVAEHDCPEINSSQRWCLCKKRPCGMEPLRPGQQQVFYL